MKTLKLTIGFIFILGLCLTIVFFIVMKNFDLDKFKLEITNQLSSALGRSVNIGSLSLGFSLKEGMTVNIDGLKILENPEYRDGFFINVDKIKLTLNLLTFFKKKEILVSNLHIASPQLRIVRNEKDRWNIQDVLQQLQRNALKAKEDESAALNNKMGFPLFFINMILMEQGNILVEDHFEYPPRALEIDKIDVQIAEFSLTDPFDFETRCAFFSENENLQVTGKAQMDLLTQKGRLDDVRITMGFSQDAFFHLKRAVPFIEDFIVEKEGGRSQLQASISQMVVGKEGLLLLALEGEFLQDDLFLKQLQAPLQNLKINFSLSERDLVIQSFSMQLGGGGFSGDGSIDEYLTQQRYAIALKGQDVDLKNVLPQFESGVSIEGIVNTDITIKGEGLTGKNDLGSMKGEGSLLIGKGQIRHANILEMVLNQFPVFPDLLERILESNISGEYRDLLTRDVTHFDKIFGNFDLAGERMEFKKFELLTQEFLFTGNGSLDMEDNMEITSALILEKSLSDHILSQAKEFQALFEENQITIPLQRYEGKAASLKLMPDLEFIMRKIVQSMGVEDIQKLLNKMSGREEVPQPATETKRKKRRRSEDPEIPEKSPEKTPEEQFLQGLLEKIQQEQSTP